MNLEQAETIALRALGWLAANDDLCPVFLGATGASIDDIRTQATEPAFLASVLDFLTMDDEWVVQMCDALELPYETPLQARYALPGAESVHWT
ncbi:DUF3572 domain-containing protein [Marivivens sp. JLT3646]|uniref:DUF3572 domain-containing protein n=1 Tax=Marivivens sp. JLT3646 TaxID=1920883 RepID=UPI0007FEA31F|nr:DUF3572 domain-containing protein [Marivivens sp. JLT3646]APO87102.1 hypothetical protein BSK21_08680 [Marivivens sp. JLT3646]OBR39827.1 hypothetical protein A9199_02365 [Donghicola sp. JL3646]